FAKGNDWRALVPFVFLGVLAAALYFLMTYKEVTFTQETIILSLALLACLALTTAFGWYALSKGEVSVYFAILTVSAPLTIFAASFLFPGEKLSMLQWLGVVLGMVSVYLVSTG
ncbi:MAG: EamA family transporter, partial [Candidatus Micrarchaeia archaeon]